MNKNFIFFAFFSLLYTITICGEPKPDTSKKSFFNPGIPAISTDAVVAFSPVCNPSSSVWTLCFPTFFKGYASSLYTQAWQRLKPVWPWRFNDLAHKNAAIFADIVRDHKAQMQIEVEKKELAIAQVRDQLAQAKKHNEEHLKKAQENFIEGNDKLSILGEQIKKNQQEIEKIKKKNESNKEKYKQQVELFSSRFHRIRFLVQPHLNNGMHHMFSSFAKKEEHGYEVPRNDGTYNQTETSSLD